MEFLLPLTFEILAFDTFVAGLANAAIQFVVVPLAVRRVVDYVECRSLERLLAGLADETVLVIPPSQATVRRGYRFPLDGLATSFTISFRS